jgi:hypothetical protein
MKNIEYYYDLPANSTTDEHLSLIEADIGGGRISPERIDSIAAHPKKMAITISGLTQKTFEYFIREFGAQFKAIIFWKCPLVEDLTPLESLNTLEHVIYFWNQRATRLWDMSKNPRLVGLAFDDFTRMHSLVDVVRSRTLRELQFGDRIWTKYVLDSLAPLSKCQNLRRLAFSAKKILRHDIRPLAQLQDLDQLEFPYHLFKVEEVAWLTAHLPKTVKSRCLQPFHTIEKPLDIGGKRKDTIIIGKGKPFLDSRLDAQSIAKYSDKFEALVRNYRQNPKLGPAPKKPPRTSHNSV